MKVEISYEQNNSEATIMVFKQRPRKYRIEHDTMGKVKVPIDAYWGAQTQRTLEVFKISDLKFPRRFIRSIGIVKLATARANIELKLLNANMGTAIVRASKEVIDGKFDRHFPLDIFQTGSGTSTNMNANEVIANRATELLRGKKNNKHAVHPNNHVNLGQSTNDVFPTVVHIAAKEAIQKELLPNMKILLVSLSKKAKEFRNYIKAGRTHLQDAVPITLGQEFSGYAETIKKDIARIEVAERSLDELAIGGTAVGTGLNTHPKFSQFVIQQINKMTGLNFRRTVNYFEALQSRNALLELSGATKEFAVSLMRISRDLRLLNSGPKTGLNEISLPAITPGSSIMPGKVNPVIPEATALVAAKVIGNDMTITIAAQNGELELNMMMPLIAYSILESIECEANICRILSKKCIDGIRGNKNRCLTYAKKSLSLVTILTPIIGYDKAAEVYKEALISEESIPEIIIRKGILTQSQLKKMDLMKMTSGGRIKF
jgi:fumarate hydratase class II